MDGVGACGEWASADAAGPYGLEIRETLKAQVAFFDRVAAQLKGQVPPRPRHWVA